MENSVISVLGGKTATEITFEITDMANESGACDMHSVDLDDSECIHTEEEQQWTFHILLVRWSI